MTPLNHDQIDPSGHTLTTIERQVVKRICMGQTSSMIAAAYSLSMSEIHRKRRRIYDKLGVRDFDEFKALAIKHEWMKSIVPETSASPMAFDTIEAAAGPQYRFLVGTLGDDAVFRFEKKGKRDMGSVEHGYFLRQHYEDGARVIYEDHLRDYRVAYPTYEIASDAAKPFRGILARVIPFLDGFLVASSVGTLKAATLRLDRKFRLEVIDGELDCETFAFLLNPETAEWFKKDRP